MGKAIVIFLIPVIISILGVIAVNSYKGHEIDHKPAAYGPGTGYELVPEEYTVTASSHYKWHHGTSPGWLWIVGIILFAAGGAYLYNTDKEVKTISWKVLAVIWLAGLFSLFGKHVIKYNKKEYVKTIDKETYEANKGNLDAIFQQ